MNLAWVYLLLAGLLEVCWAVGLKYTDRFTRTWPSVFTITTLVASLLLLSKAVQTLPIGTAYSIWVGIGAFGAAVMGALLFQESISILKGVFLLMLLVAVVGLKFTSN